MNNTPHTTAAGTFHESVRTAVSDNTNPHTGERTQVVSSTRLLMQWVGDDLRMRFASTRQVMDSQPATGAVA